MSTTTTKGAPRGRIVQRISYAVGNLGQAAFYNALSTYFVTYYAAQTLFSHYGKSEAKALIGIITALVFIIRIAEIFLDPLLGNLIDNTNTRFGRFRPWQVIGGVVSSVLMFAIFTGLFGLVNVDKTVFIVVFIIVFILLDIFYSIRDISYWGMIPALSTESHERGVFTALGMFTGSVGYNGITVVVIPIVSFFSGLFASSSGQTQAGWTAFGAIIAVLGIVTALAVAFGTTEQESALRAKAKKNTNPLQAFVAIARNDQLRWVALSYLLYAVANVATTGFMLYLFTFVLRMPSEYSIVGVIAFVAGLATTPLYPLINRRVPRRSLYLGGLGMLVAAYVLFILFSGNVVVVFIALVLFYVPATFIQMTAILSLTDSVEYGQLKTGKRDEAVTLSVRPMLDKIAGAVSNSIVGFVAIAAAMTNGADPDSLTAGNIQTFKTAAFYAPLAFIVLSALTFMFKVTLSEKAHEEIVAQLEAKLGEEGDGERDEEGSAKAEKEGCVKAEKEV